MSIVPNWHQHISIKGFEQEFGLTYSGPGWYGNPGKSDVVLVVPLPPDGVNLDTLWHATQPEGTVLHVHVWNAPLRDTLISRIAGAPSRTA